MKDPNDVDFTELIDNIERELRINRNIPLPMNLLVIKFFGKHDDSYRELWFTWRAKLKIRNAIRTLRDKTGLHIFSLGKGYVVIETEKQFETLVTRFDRLRHNVTLFTHQLRLDMNNPAYKEKVMNFFKIKVSQDEFNHRAKMLVKQKLRLKRQKMYDRRKKSSSSL